MNLEKNFNKERKNNVVIVKSDIPSFEKKDKEIEIKLEKNGKSKALAFFDIDGTLGEFMKTHGEAIAMLYPQADRQEVIEEFEKGISLGTTYRVHDRMIKIFENGIDEFKDPKKYMEWFSIHQKEVDEAGPIHEKAAAYSLKHSQMSAKIAEELYEQNPHSFDELKILPVFHLVKLYKRLGIPLVVMTANDEPFAQSISKCLGLSDSFITMASQKDFEGYGKDRAMEFLIKKLENKGIPIPEKLIVIGDSLNGDIGSAALFQEKFKDFNVSGVFVSKENVETAKKIVKDTELLKKISVEVLSPQDISNDKFGQPELSKYRNKHNTKNN